MGLNQPVWEILIARETIEGAGVRLHRAFGYHEIPRFDPFLMLDDFRGDSPADYVKGFPWHPHRGIETVTYMLDGLIEHGDSMGNAGIVGTGAVQWMTAGSGIMHEERLPAAERMLGVQLWLNLPAKDKMAPPAYHSIKNSEIEEIAFDWGKLRLLSGEFEGRKGYISKYLPLNYYDIHLNPNASVIVNTENERSVMLFTLLGDAYIGDELIKEKTAVKLTSGDHVMIKATDEKAQVLFISSVMLAQPIAWGGPIVMNTVEELNKAFDDLRRGTFLQDKISY